ncbi:MAG: alkaline phosphatase [Planctomycetota bacterium]|jgi:alkaline phosphatase
MKESAGARRKQWILLAALSALAFLFSAGVAAGQGEADEAAPRAKVKAKNVIVMISDGRGYGHVDAASVYRHGRTGALNYQKFPVAFAMSTYPVGGGYDPEKARRDFDYVKSGATDSAAAATALATGRKSYAGAIGTVGSKEASRPVGNVIEAAEKLGKASGVVTSSFFSDATPACFVTHNADRSQLETIARRMILESAVDVIMGCGHPHYDRSSEPFEEPESFKFVGGEETWKALKAGSVGGDADGDGEPDPWRLVETREEFRARGSGPTPKRLCGVPQVEVTLQQKRKGDNLADPYVVPLTERVPTLAEMTRAALNVLDNDEDGFLLMVEGGAVDTASHRNQSGRMIEEELDFVDAVDAVVQWVETNSSWEETLLIVTGDHETGYLTGPGSGKSEEGEDSPPVWNPIENRGKGALPGMQWNSTSHTNSLIPLYARGAGSELLERYADETDPVRGRYIDNAEVGKVIFEVIGP